MKIQKITSKDVNTKFGPKKAYRIQADGEWYGYGLKKPTFAEGDEVMFTFTENDYGKQVDLATVKVISKGGGEPAPSTATGSAPAPRTYGPPAKVFPIPALHGDRAIVRQNSLTNAVNLLKDKFPEDAESATMAKDVIAVARMFEAYSCGDLDVEMAEKMLGDE